MLQFLRVLILIQFIVVASPGFSQDKPEYAISKISPALLRDAEAVIRFEESKYVIESPRKYAHHVTKAVTILDGDSEEAYVIVFYDQYSKAELSTITLYDAAGTFIRKVKKSEILDQATFDGLSILTDERLKGIRSFGGQLPYTVEYTWSVSYDQTLYYEDWIPADFNVSVEKATFILETPSDLNMQTKAINYDFDVKEEKFTNRIIRKWTISNHPAIEKEKSGPPYHELLPMLIFSPETFQINEFTGSLSGWKSFGAFMHDINKGKEIMPPQMKEVIQQITKDCETSFDKIDTLYKWLQKNMRYVSIQLGIGGWQSFDAQFVEKNRYGDCKALSTFMKGMLKEAGIDSYQTLIMWDEQDKLYFDDFVTIDFNHMMLYIPSEDIWLECTSNNLPTGVIDKDEENKKVLLITPEGGKIATTPLTSIETNQTITVDSIFLKEKVLIKGSVRYSGNDQRMIRHLYYNSSSEGQRKAFLEHFPLAITKLENLRISVDPKEFISTIEFKAHLDHFGNISGERIFIPLNAIHPVDNPCDGNVSRKTDYISKENFQEINNIYITIPENYSVEFIPPTSTYTFKGNQFKISATRNDNVIHVKHEITETPFRQPTAEYKELCNYYTSIMKANQQMIVLKKAKT